MELMIGRVTKSHGVRGEVAVESTTDVPEERFAVGEMLTGKQSGRELQLTVKTVRPHKNRLLITFEEIKDRTEADTLRGMRFFAEPREDADDDGFYDHELEGLKVRVEGSVIGTVTSVSHAAGRTLLSVELLDGRETMVPFVYDIVPEVVVDEGFLVCTPPEGLLEL